MPIRGTVATIIIGERFIIVGRALLENDFPKSILINHAENVANFNRL